MTADPLVCWKCGALLAAEPLPLARAAECPSCHADLHVCRLCEFYDPALAKSCREPVADAVQDKVRANFCGYFQPRPHAFTVRDMQPVQDARNGLDALFGDDSTPVSEGNGTGPTRQSLDKLFDTDKD